MAARKLRTTTPLQRQDAAFHAAKALESTIKIISDDKSWSTGRERAAANYIDNLVSCQNGRFLVPWEGNTLKAYFIHGRNPHGHGADATIPALTSHQTDWAIETAMAWIKNLIRRTRLNRCSSNIGVISDDELVQLRRRHRFPVMTERYGKSRSK
ncbi:hypothetical protein FBZ93_117173 [Bradyrhizobium macuxiense]|uniref:Uncharacterized protein n=1 Tax=Bradyrhizobium macuxiense TaxID=1755647 RepID=A0A560L126_9BRAD|nr:hypothetical protein [Bradyrhizobium macuxiense]TWB88989.1 hypothetical protein FBZ93_117173 [Bradyrhizobium macuxiense]